MKGSIPKKNQRIFDDRSIARQAKAKKTSNNSPTFHTWNINQSSPPYDPEYDISKSPLENFEILNERILHDMQKELEGSTSPISAVLPPIIGSLFSDNEREKLKALKQSVASLSDHQEQKHKQFRSELVNLIM
ncbi:hypothetical protein HMI54_015543 [Coelomomyces lativittatus]|nr:hypothetical protein HMI56_001719 [Coelomomyces lativittatus]KAJ1512719.1 hypothetical protein HMI54_015543 [Coelomomyces lativittatus]